jgi:hypothetical protein
MRFARVAEPPGFDAVRLRGEAWLAEHAAPARPPSWWLPYVPHLAEGFDHRCGYTAMHIEDGTLDHYLSVATHRGHTYRWDNYRFISGRMNSVKKNADARVLDPFEVGDDWFEILLPSLQLVPTDRIPPEERERAAYTLKRLGLRDGAPVMRRREHWFAQFRGTGLSLDGLRQHAPLIGRAVDKRLSRLDAATFGEARAHYERFLGSELTLLGLRADAPSAFQAVSEVLRAPD